MFINPKSLVDLAITKILDHFPTDILTNIKIREYDIKSKFPNLPEDCYNKIYAYVNKKHYVYILLDNDNKIITIMNDQYKAFCARNALCAKILVNLSNFESKEGYYCFKVGCGYIISSLESINSGVNIIHGKHLLYIKDEDLKNHYYNLN